MKTSGEPRAACGVSRSNSRARGIHFKTVTPRITPPAADFGKPLPTTLPASSHHAPPIPPPAPAPATPPIAELASALPLLKGNLDSLAINEQLRLLALKEMAVVELKDALSTLKGRLADSERDLQQLRAAIQRLLYQQLQGQAHEALLRDDASAHGLGISEAQPQVLRRKRLVSARPKIDKLDVERASLKDSDSARASNGADHPRAGSKGPHPRRASKTAEPAAPESSRIWSNLSKPISFIQSLDTMILQEFEKSLAGNSMPPPHRAQLPPASQKHTTPKQTPPHVDPSYLASEPDDMFQAVTSSVWNFVNDMKTNMLALNEDGRVTKDTHRAVSPYGASDPETTLDLVTSCSDDEEADAGTAAVDLSMYSSMRRKR